MYLKVQENVAGSMIDQLRFEYVDETSSDSISEAWNKMQQDVRLCLYVNRMSRAKLKVILYVF